MAILQQVSTCVWRINNFVEQDEGRLGSRNLEQTAIQKIRAETVEFSLR